MTPGSTTLRPIPRPRPPSLQTAEDFYSRGPSAVRPRQLTIDVIGSDGVLYRTWYSNYVEQELNRLLELPDGWDGRHAARTTFDAVQTTVDVLPAISDEQTLPPQFFPLPDGGIQVEWHVAGAAIEIEIDGGGEAYAVALNADKEILFEQEIGANETKGLSVLRSLVSNLSALATEIG